MRSPVSLALEQHFTAIAVRHLVGAFCGLIGFTALVLVFFLRIDPDVFFGGDRLALKVGGTVLTLPQFRTLQSLAGPEGMRMSGGEFARRLVDTLLLAEAARSRHLDKTLEYLDKVKAFDRAISPASETQDLSRALFLIEELGRMIRRDVAREVAVAGDARIPVVPVPVPASGSSGMVPGGERPEKLHLRTIQVGDAGQVLTILNHAAAGASFDQLNASWSCSPYAPVQGDLGRVSSMDLPAGVFERLAKTPVGSLTIGYADETGTHLFLIVDKVRPSSMNSQRTLKGISRQHLESRQILEFLEEQKRRIPVWINPALFHTRS
jgi:hypothetical protein